MVILSQVGKLFLRGFSHIQLFYNFKSQTFISRTSQIFKQNLKTNLKTFRLCILMKIMQNRVLNQLPDIAGGHSEPGKFDTKFKKYSVLKSAPNW